MKKVFVTIFLLVVDELLKLELVEYLQVAVHLHGGDGVSKSELFAWAQEVPRKHTLDS